MHLRPTRAELLAAYGRRVPDLIASDLKVLFCGINPSLYSAAVGHHFARPGNRFWPTLHAASFTDRRLDPSEEAELLCRGIGITNLVSRATASADDLTADEIIRGGKRLIRKVRRFRPRVLAILGVSAFRIAWRRPDAVLGWQSEGLGDTLLWVLPNPSGLNAHYQLNSLTRLFGELRRVAEE